MSFHGGRARASVVRFHRCGPAGVTMAQRTPEPPARPDPDDLLLAGKVRIPRRRAGVLPRPVISAQLDAATARDLTLVCAPAGFGKTTALAEWAHTSRRPVAWLTLDEGDNDATRFWSNIAAALCPPAFDATTHAPAEFGSAASEPSIRTVAALLTRAGEQLVLVLDDYHLIDAAPVHAAVTDLVERLAPRLRIVIAGRADPPLPLGRLRARGQLAEVRAADLAFTADQTAALLREVAGIALADTSIAALAERTEGWAAGLQLATLSLQERADPDAFVAAFSGTHRHVLDYLAGEVLDRQSDDTVTFLLDTSVLDQVSGPLADAVTGRHDGQQMLERIERANLFLVPLDDDRAWWRYHHLFADLLRARLRHRHPERVAALHRAAADWWDHNGASVAPTPWRSADPAIRHAVAAQDHERAARLIERHFDATFRRGEETTLGRWLGALPSDVAEARPRVVLIQAFLSLFAGGLDEGRRLVDKVEHAARRGIDEQFAPSAGRHASLVANVPAAIAVLHIQIAWIQGDADGIRAHGSAAQAALTADDVGLAFITGDYLAMAAWMDGRVVDAERELRALAAATQRTASSYQTAWPRFVLGRVLLTQGRLAEAERAFAAAARDLPLGHTGLAKIAYQRDDLTRAMQEAAAGVDGCRRLAHALPLAESLATLAWIRHAAGDASGALDALDEAARALPSRGITALLDPVPTMRVRLLLARGDVDEAARWITAHGWDRSDDLRYTRLREHLAVARTRLAQGRPHEAEALLSRLRVRAVAQHRTGDVIEIQALRALALAAQNDEAAALATLREAVTLAADAGHVRVFTDEGATMADLLARLYTRRDEDRADGRTDEHTAALLRAFGAASADRGTRGGTASGLVVPLTDREVEVLERLAAGRSNQQIASELFVALVTVKKHVSHILDKLGAANRTEAVARARALGLLP
jgi:LuxR family maltose regulon positive regulatory protein